MGSKILNVMDMDPFLENEKVKVNHFIHIKLNPGKKARQYITLVEGLDSTLDFKKIIATLKKMLHCSGALIVDQEHGHVIHMSGDQRKSIADFLVQEEIVHKDQLKIHGF